MASNGMAEFKELEKNTLLYELIAHIEKMLPDFVSSNTFEKIMVKKTNETQHSTAFSVFMMKAQDQFTFMNEVAQKGKHKVDVAVYDKASDMLFTIEAKVLPTPAGTTKKPRAQSEYVYSGQHEMKAGIQRFKEGNHGVDNNECNLPQSAMLAYIKNEDFGYWMRKINGWVLEASWTDSEILKKNYFKKIGKLHSNHKRMDDSIITLHHFWVYVS